ncbi:response regulator [Methanococcoides sp. LMO-2]|uniref:Response regulator n=1 Tax=Methanococcoides cohabitans TaxID=3136559 RepID=A0ABU9KU12_9EURY
MKKVVIVDDLIDSTILKLMLKLKGYSVLSMAPNVEEVISLVESTPPDLVIMNINLKDTINGLEIAMVIREGYGIPVIFVTADFSKVVRKRVDLVG